MAFMKQEERVSILKELKEELIEYKNEFEMLKEFNSFDDSFLASEPRCKNVKLISSYDLHISTVLPLEHKGIRCGYVCVHVFVFQRCPLYRGSNVIERSHTRYVIVCYSEVSSIQSIIMYY